MRLQGVCNGGFETTVWGHINSIRWGSGKGHKSPDICGLFVCSDCHDILDGRVKSDFERDFIKLAALTGHMESLYILSKEGII